MTPPPLTVAIPFFNEERYLASAVHSILNQTLGDFELLLIDDGSRDRSLQVAHSFRDRRIAVLSDGKHRGLAARLNEVTRRAQGEIIARMDADDVAHPTRFARELEHLRDSGCDAVGTWAGLFDDSNEALAVVESGPLPPSPSSALEGGILCHATMLARRRWLRENAYDESLMRAEDRDLWCRTASTSSFSVVKEPLYAIRVNGNAAGFADEYSFAHRLNRRLFLRYGPRAIGLRRTAQAWMMSCAKSGLVHLAARIGLGSALVRRRGRGPTSRERELIDEAIRSAAVPADQITNLVDDRVTR